MSIALFKERREITLMFFDFLRRFCKEQWYRQEYLRLLEREGEPRINIANMACFLTNYFYYTTHLRLDMPLTEKALSTLQQGIASFLEEAKTLEWRFDNVLTSITNIPYYGQRMRGALQDVVNNHCYWYDAHATDERYHLINPQKEARRMRHVSLVASILFAILFAICPSTTYFRSIFAFCSSAALLGWLIGITYYFYDKTIEKKGGDKTAQHSNTTRQYIRLGIFSVIFCISLACFFIDCHDGRPSIIGEYCGYVLIVTAPISLYLSLRTTLPHLFKS